MCSSEADVGLSGRREISEGIERAQLLSPNPDKLVAPHLVLHTFLVSSVMGVGGG